MKTAHVALVLVTSFALGCTWNTALPSDAQAIHVDRDRELVVTDDASLGPLSSNQANGPLSFQSAFSGLGLPDGAELLWLNAWAAALPTDRGQTLTQRLTCAWLKSAPENQCDDACLACAANVLRPESAPFRLIAVANRTDLSDMPDRAAGGGEGRLVFALTGGPADDDASAPLPLTVIFEYAQVGTALEWATRWHALGSSQAFATDLTHVVQSFGPIAQIRTADAFTGAMVLHQFEVNSTTGKIGVANVRNTPAWDQIPVAAMQAFASTNDAAITAGTDVVPAAWLAASSAPSDTHPAWVDALPERDALIRETCGGCHALSPTTFQIDPLAKGTAKLSSFLVDPNGNADEITRRTEWMQLTLTQGK